MALSTIPSIWDSSLIEYLPIGGTPMKFELPSTKKAFSSSRYFSRFHPYWLNSYIMSLGSETLVKIKPLCPSSIMPLRI
jgi:hypothetical protein